MPGPGRRLLVVSGHYPPDFVSGGTLVPQSLARHLRDRGWDVSVYAGAIHSGRPDLDTWPSDDGDSPPVRWISVSASTSWNDSRSYDNPGVAGDFRRHLAVLRPDVIHLHNLQGVGAGLIPVARASGARVVVTAHDFWWWCGRQFLCDRDLHPCALVSDLGDCPCQVTAGWRRDRAQRLMPLLRQAHTILAPSEIAARVLIGNGVPRHLVRVDENAVEAPPAVTRRVGPRQPLRMLYVGGDSPLKGVDVLLDALRQLDGLPEWSATLYGVPPTRSPAAGSKCRPSFPPDRLGDVLADHDVLVLPSLARESFSRAAREALLAGLAVVTSDCLGPEEVVEDGVNGLVVPSGDAAALAEALRRLVTEPELLERLRSAPAPRVRTLDEQVDGLERLYEELLGGDPDPRPQSAPTPARVLLVAGIHGAPLRYRVRHLEEALRLGGTTTEAVYYRDPRLGDLMAAADAVVLYRTPMTAQLQAALDHLRRVRPGTPVLFDVDDLIIDEQRVRDLDQLASLDEQERDLWFRGVRRYRESLLASDAATTSTPAIAAAMAETGVPSYVVPNGVGGVTARRSAAALDRPRKPGAVRLGYFSGTATHDHDWALIEPAMARVLGERPDVRLWLVGHVAPGPALDGHADRVDRLPFTDWQHLPDLLRDTDIVLAPLVPSEFADAKSAIKWLEAALVRTPTVASPTEAFQDAIKHGRTGFLASSQDDWHRYLLELIDDTHLRDRIGRAAEREALLRYGPHVRREQWLEAFHAAQVHAAEGPRPAPKRDEDRWPDEPPTPERLEDYPFVATGGRSGRVRAAWQRGGERAVVYRSILAETWRAEGPVGVVTKAGRRLRRYASRRKR